MSHKTSIDLRAVEKPSRYAGGEWNVVVKKDPVDCRLLLAFPDVYEIGMSHLGLRILYGLVNGNDGLAAERAFAPWPDMEALMREHGEPLRSLETGRPAAEFDILGFSLQHELNYTNLLNMLDLSGLPLRAAERDERAPLVIAGGPAVFNPEPTAPFFDLFVIGDAEELLPALMRQYAELRRRGARKREVLEALARNRGVYAPALYEAQEDAETGFIRPAPGGAHPLPVRKAVVADLDRFPFPAATVVPFCEIVHDRVAVEIARGCSRGCRFCQAGVIYLPERERDAAGVAEAVWRSLEATGYGDVSLSSLTPNDYSALPRLVRGLMRRLRGEGISLSLASLSPSGLDAELLELVKSVRKTGLTIAPEAGTQRLRDVLNKGIGEEDILRAARTAFELGWKLIKLYFMIGLPTETDADADAIADLSRRIASLRRGVKVNVTVSNFVPKPHTPFQWLPMAEAEELREKQRFILDRLRRSPVTVKLHDVEESLLEGTVSRGDRRVAAALEEAWRLGCRFDSWSEHKRPDLWQEAFDRAGIDPRFYLHRPLRPGAALPWSHIDPGVKEAFLREELRLALRGEAAARCAPRNCALCGACPPEILKEKWPKQADAGPEIILPQKTRPPVEPQRLRLRYSKRGAVGLLSHLDLVRLTARVFRRAGVPVVMSKGFHPQPRISFGPALPLGTEGLNEYLDAWLQIDFDEETLLDMLNRASPDGLRFSAARRLEAGELSLSSAVCAAAYLLRRADGSRFTLEAIEEFMSAERCDFVRRRRGREQRLELRSRVLEMTALDGGRDLRLLLSLEADAEGPQARPEDVAEAAFHLDWKEIVVLREQLFVRRGAELITPMQAVD